MLRHRVAEAEDISGGDGGVVGGGSGGIVGGGGGIIRGGGGVVGGGGGGVVGSGGKRCHHHLSKYCKKGKTLIL